MLRIPVKTKPRKLKGAIIGSGSGPAERIKMLQIMVTKLVRDERIEGRQDRMDETRGYMEQLITQAIHNGDTHKPTMDMADKWLLEKDLVHKLFKVLVPRYQRYSTCFTQMHTLPASYPGLGRFDAVLELRGNPYPPVIPHQRDKSGLLSNVLLSAARSEFYWQRKQQDMDSIGSLPENSVSNNDSNIVDTMHQMQTGAEIDITKTRDSGTQEEGKGDAKIITDGEKR